MATHDADTEAQHVVVQRNGPVLLLRLNRAERGNAYTQSMLARLDELLTEVEQTPEARILVISGTGSRSFCAGADRGELATRDWQTVLHLASARVFERLRTSRCITLAAVNGAAVGGGLELALACDFRLAASSARFWLPEPELGLLPAAGGTFALASIVGLAKAKEIILGGAVWDAQEAFRWGLVNEVVADDQLLSRVEAWCERLLRRDPVATQLAKQAMQLERGNDAARQFALVAQSLLVCRGSAGSRAAGT
jgi:enoyl-CoA hydratase